MNVTVVPRGVRGLAKEREREGQSREQSKAKQRELLRRPISSRPKALRQRPRKDHGRAAKRGLESGIAYFI